MKKSNAIANQESDQKAPLSMHDKAQAAQQCSGDGPVQGRERHSSSVWTDAKLTLLLFEWPLKTAPRLALPLFIFLAAFLHLSTIYLFNIAYEVPRGNKSMAAQVFFLLPTSTASQQLAPWLEANDPAIFSPLKIVQANRPKIPSSIYQLSQPAPVLRPLPPAEADKMDSLLPPAHEIVTPSFFSSDHSSTEQTTALSIPKITTVCLLDTLATRAPQPPAVLGYPSLPPTITTPLAPTLLKANVDAAGIPRHVMILQSSGNDTADEAATHWFMTTHFAPANEETWGTLLIFWGRD